MPCSHYTHSCLWGAGGNGTTLTCEWSRLEGVGEYNLYLVKDATHWRSTEWWVEKIQLFLLCLIQSSAISCRWRANNLSSGHAKSFAENRSCLKLKKNFFNTKLLIEKNAKQTTDESLWGCFTKLTMHFIIIPVTKAILYIVKFCLR